MPTSYDDASSSSRSGPCICRRTQDWVPLWSPRSLTISDVVDALDLTAFSAPVRSAMPRTSLDDSRCLHHPGLRGRTRSPTRAVARKLEEDVAFRLLGGGQLPPNRTVPSSWTPRHLGEGLFVQVTSFAREMGLARFGNLSIDGTKVARTLINRKAYAAKRPGGTLAVLEIVRAVGQSSRRWTPKKHRALGRGFPRRRTARTCNAGRSAWQAIQAAKARFSSQKRS